jgi:hypothetical protein
MSNNGGEHSVSSSSNVFESNVGDIQFALKKTAYVSNVYEMTGFGLKYILLDA